MEETLVFNSLTEVVQSLYEHELISFLAYYNEYVQEFYEEHDEGSQPVSMLEYINNDYQADGYKITLKRELTRPKQQ